MFLQKLACIVCVLSTASFVAGEYVYSSYLLNSPYALAYPHLNAPLITAFPSTSPILLKHHTPEHTAQQEKEKEEKNKDKPKEPQPHLTPLIYTHAPYPAPTTYYVVR